MKKKILFINGHMNAGGGEKALLDILLKLDYRKYEVDLLLLEELGDFAPQLPQDVHVILRSLENTHGPFTSCILRCLREHDWFSLKMRLVFLLMKFNGQKNISLARKLLVGEQQYDCVIAFRPGICTQIAAYACRANRRITWWHHGEINVAPKEYAEAALAFDKIAVVSNSCREMLEQSFPDLADKLTVIPNIIDADAIQGNSLGEKPYSTNDILNIVSVGRLEAEKHFENALFAARHLKGQVLAFCWHLIGAGSLRNELERKAKELQVEDCVVFEGKKTNPYPYLRHADLFVHPSYVESQGIVVLEAMSLGVPCVVTKSLGPCEFIQDGVNGLLTEQSAESLTEKVFEILQDHELYKRIKENTFCPKQFLPENVMEKMNELLEGEE